MKENLSLLQQLINVSRVDGSIDEMEYNLMVRMAELLGLQKLDVDELLYDTTEFNAVPKSEFDRILQFHRLVLLTNVDAHVNSEELVSLRKCGLYLKLRPEAIEAVLNEMKHHPNGMIPTEIMMTIFQRYHN